MRILLAAMLALLSSNPLGFAQQAALASPVAQVSFQFDRPGVEVPKFTLTVDEEGSARYQAEQVIAKSRATDTDSPPATQRIDRQIILSHATTRQIFAAARELNRFDFPCASNLKNIADTGKKKLRYIGKGGEGTCVYNYSQDKRVVALTNMFMAIAGTLNMGRKLDFDHRFDRLGLDADMAYLVQEVDEGRAAELGTIRSTLQSIAEDSEVLERVRSRAVKMLRQAQAAP